MRFEDGRRYLTLALKFPRDMFLLVDLVGISERNNCDLEKHIRNAQKPDKEEAGSYYAGDTERGGPRTYILRAREGHHRAWHIRVP